MVYLGFSKSKIGYIGQYVVIIIFSILALLGFISMVGVIQGISRILDVILIVSSIIVIASLLFSREFVISRVEYRLNRLCLNNEFTEALELIDKKLDSKLFNYKRNLLALKGMVLIKKGNLGKADQIFTKLEKEYQNSLSLLYYKACLESMRGNNEKAMSYLKKNIKIQNHLIRQTKNPISRQILRKRLRRFVSIIKNDENLSNIYNTSEFKMFISKYSKNDGNINLATAFITSSVFAVLLLIIGWVQYSMIHPLPILIGFIVIFFTTLIFQRFDLAL